MVMAEPQYADGFEPNFNRMLAIRLTIPRNLVLQEFWISFDTICEGIFVAFHDDQAEEHWHLALYNTFYDHDATRKKIIKLIKEFWPEAPKGNALMCVKKYRGEGRYLVYMLKGHRYEVTANIRFRADAFGNIIRNESLIRASWRAEGSPTTDAYKSFKTSMWFPLIGIETRTLEDAGRDEKSNWVERTTFPPFNTIKKNAITFALQYLKKDSIDGKVRFLVKDLISNFAWYEDYDLRPYYI